MSGAGRSGRFEGRELPGLLLELQGQRFTGELSLAHERLEKRIRFREGAPVFVESSLARESLAAQLFESGRISHEDRKRVAAYASLKKCREAGALLALRVLGAKELLQAVREQVRRGLIDCFGWPDGAYALAEGEAAPEDARALRVDLASVIQGGIAVHWSVERVLGALEPRLAQYAARGAGFRRAARRLESDAGVERLLESFDGTRRLGEAIHAAGSALALAAAWVLDATGALDYANAPPEMPAEPDAADGDAAEPEIEVVVTGSDQRREPEGQARGSRPSAAAAKPSRERQAESLREAILDRHRRLDELDHYELLGIARDADAGAVKRAYFSFAKRFHPDALASAGLESLRAEASAVFARVSKAYATLSDPHERRDYDARLEGGADDEGEAERLASAETLFRKSQILLRKGDFKGALDYLRPAVELWPEDPGYQGALGWALFKQPRPDPAAARAHLEKAVTLDANDPVTLFRLAVVRRHLGEHEAAESLFRRARSIDPKVA